METETLFSGLLELFRAQIPEVDFFDAYPGRPGSRMLSRPTVVGEVCGETLKQGSEEVKLRFSIFLPAGTEGKLAENIFASMCALAGKHYPGFSAISRGEMKRDGSTGLLKVECFLSFLTVTGGTAQGCRAVLGGREYRVSGIKTSVNRSAEELISVGETEPFALRNEKTEYTVELEGINVSGLDRLAGFTAELGEGPDAVYLGCRWKSISDVLRKAVFLSHSKME